MEIEELEPDPSQNSVAPVVTEEHEPDHLRKKSKFKKSSQNRRLNLNIFLYFIAKYLNIIRT